MKGRSRSRIRGVVSWALSLVMIVAGVMLIASFFLAGRLDSTATNSQDPGSFNVPNLGAVEDGRAADAGPENKTLKLTVPAMARIEDDTISTTAGNDEEALKQNAGIHLEGTGFPWQEEANVYIAGHRLGFVNTESWLAFWDLDKVGKGDEVFVTDAESTTYTYEVFKQFIVGPSDLSVTKPEPGKNILTLQTCTLPDYSQRLIVQAELKDTQRSDEGSRTG